MERINSSYAENNYGPLFEAMVRMEKPRLAVEFGILEGYSTEWILKGLKACGGGWLESHDLFEGYPFHHAKYDCIRDRFAADITSGRLTIHKSDFWQDADMYRDGIIDFMHVDISNDGNVYEGFFSKYLQKLRPGGLAILEGGGKGRDVIPWMVKYGKLPIRPVLEAHRWLADSMTFEAFPSMTLIRRRG